MTVYVEPLVNRGWVLRGRETPNCHLFTDSQDLEELHTFAGKIGMKRSWFQNDSDHPHYDLTPARRALAVQAGAKEVDFQTAVAIIRARRIMVGIGA